MIGRKVARPLQLEGALIIEFDSKGRHGMCPTSPSTTTPSPSRQSAGFHVLLVTEDPMLLSTFTRGLFRFGHRITQISSSQSAWDMLRGPVAIAADAVVVDLTRLRPDWRDLAKQISEQIPLMPVTALCGLQDDLCSELEKSRVKVLKIARNPADLDAFLRRLIFLCGGYLRRLNTIPALPAPKDSDRG